MVGYETKENLINATSKLFNDIMMVEYLCLDCYNYSETDSLARELKIILSETSQRLAEIVNRERVRNNGTSN